MAKKIIRRSPSGPVVGSLGPGAMIRMAEGSITGSQTFTSAAPATVNAGGPPLEVSLDDPKSDLQYRVECEFALLSSDSGTQSLTIELRADYDGAGPAVIETLNLTLPGLQNIHVHPRFTLDELPGLPADCQTVVFDCLVTTSSATGAAMNGNASAAMSVSEHVAQA